ncbi:hypothetical protein CYY_005028 [Polysphondylium violaceum]|uniref:Phosphatidic acid phosphatase type 2/haloperoxidase domain-containing protein n=1 Tax=Polysphondylium violaceum TaxID=133409 RepID=A0A8J4UZY3_9MYCE|nr:hypothetical protein CYY_005028 [Polysphondylium violaceum]
MEPFDPINSKIYRTINRSIGSKSNNPFNTLEKAVQNNLIVIDSSNSISSNPTIRNSNSSNNAASTIPLTSPLLNNVFEGVPITFDNNQNAISTPPPTTTPATPATPFWLGECLRWGLFIDFLIIILSIINFSISYTPSLPSVTLYWPLSSLSMVHGGLVIFNGLLSTWKGYSVDGKLFYAFHHFISMIFFFCSTVCFEDIQYFAAFAIYLTMRIVKRAKDDGYINKDQWVTFYISYAYAEAFVNLFVLCYYKNYKFTMIDVIGCVALIDSMITCRKENKTNKGITNYLFPVDLLANNTVQNILSVLDVLTLWSMLIYIGGLEGANYEFANIQTYQGLIIFATVEFLIKPLFKNFKRPFTYKFSNHSSFPSTHTVIAMLLVTQITGCLNRLLFVFAVGFYRVYTRAHTVEDVLAGVSCGFIFKTLWSLLF